MLAMLNYIFRKTNYHNSEIVIQNSRCFQNLHNSSASGYKRFEILYLQSGIAFTFCAISFKTINQDHQLLSRAWCLSITVENALVFPLLKKDGLEPIFKNYRPVSNLQFISKLTESAVAKQLQHHINMNNLFPLLQSSYRKFHSTKSALLKVKNDILLNRNRQHVTLLVLLDLSAAFDTIDHGILLERLRSAFRVRDTALS